MRVAHSLLMQMSVEQSTQSELEFGVAGPEWRLEAPNVRFPLGGNTGGKTTNPTISIDWIRVVDLTGGPELTEDSCISRALKDLEGWFGGPDRFGRGKDRYSHGHYWECGVQVLSGHRCAGVSIAIPGQVLATLNWNEQLELLGRLMIGRRCTRIDVAVDFKARPGLIDQLFRNVVEPMERADRDSTGRPLTQLVGARIVTPHRRWTGGKISARGVNFGRRGSDGGGLYIRCYDKGIESGEAEVGEWERWEMEAAKEHAQSVACNLVQSGTSEDKADYAFAVAMGAVDFRQVVVQQRGRWVGKMVQQARRPRAQWWVDVIGGRDTVRVKPAEPRKPTLDGLARFAADAIQPFARMAQALDVNAYALFAHLAGPLEDQVVHQDTGKTRRRVEEFMARNALSGGKLISWLSKCTLGRQGLAPT